MPCLSTTSFTDILKVPFGLKWCCDPTKKIGWGFASCVMIAAANPFTGKREQKASNGVPVGGFSVFLFLGGTESG